MDVVIACGLQKAYLKKSGGKYLGEEVDIVKTRLLEYFKHLNKKNTTVFFTREIHQTNDTFYKNDRSHSIVGSKDVEIPEVFKPYIKFIINTSRPSAFYMTPLESELNKIKPDKVFLVGFETHTNILFTAEELRNRGYFVIVFEPLLMAEDEYMHSIGINILSNVLSVDFD